MALISCPECSKEISDKAKSCPNCGYPLAKEEDSIIETKETETTTKKTDIGKGDSIGTSKLIDVDKDIKGKSSNNNTSFIDDNFPLIAVLSIVLMIGALILGVKKSKEEARLEEIKKEIGSKPAITSNYSSTTSSSVPTKKEKRESFSSSIKLALNAPGLPTMCERAYFNDLGELIIEVNGEWIVLDDGLKEDMIYALKELLKEKKGELGVEGYGQFFSTSGKGLESFYAD